MCTDQAKIKDVARQHFKNILSKNTEEEDYDDLLIHTPKIITEEMNLHLIKEIEMEEVIKAVWTLHPDKAPGPDGFSISFYRLFWEVICRDLMKIIHWVHRKKKIGGCTNSTFLSLLPKETWPLSFSRFRPVSLCNSSYKIILKILPSRIKAYLPSLISENQGGFLANRQITYSILLVQEAITLVSTGVRKVLS